MSESTSVSENVLAEKRGAVLVLTLNRPDRLNAWTDELEARYVELLDEAEADREVRAVVVTGAGRGFCAGADMEILETASDASTMPFDRPRPRTRPLEFRKPLIAPRWRSSRSSCGGPSTSRSMSRSRKRWR